MDIEEFYEADERRRESAEYEFGDEWSDVHGHLYELTWVEATGEVYLMADPMADVSVDLFGDFVVHPEDQHELAVVVIGTVPSLDVLEDRLVGWEDAMREENSLAWLARHFPEAGRP